MSMVCPECSTPHEQRLHCPRCGVRLLYQDRPSRMSISRVRLARWRQTAWGRVLIGLGLSQGLFYALRQLLTGVLGGLTGASPDQVGNLVHAVLVLQAMQAVAVVVGCLFTGAGQERGALLGVLVGGWNGALLMLFQGGQGATVVSAYGLPLLHATLGAVAGLVGSAVFRPIPSHPVPPNLAGPRKAARQAGPGLLAGPVKWGSAAPTTAWACGRSLSTPSGVKNSNAARTRCQAVSAAVA